MLIQVWKIFVGVFINDNLTRSCSVSLGSEGLLLKLMLLMLVLVIRITKIASILVFVIGNQEQLLALPIDTMLLYSIFTYHAINCLSCL